MKKYPIIYKREKYEVRWESDLLFDCVTIYKEDRILGIKYYKQVYSIDEHYLRIYLNEIGIYKEQNNNFYIDEVKYLFKLMEEDILAKELRVKREKTQKEKLKEWDGVIDVQYKRNN